MKIKTYQSGGIVYLPTYSQVEAQAGQSSASAASSSSSSKKTNPFSNAIVDLIKENGIDTDVATFLKATENMLFMSGDPSGESLTMQDLLGVARQASLVKTNYADYVKARESVDKESAWGELALNNRGQVYVFDQNNNKITTVSATEARENSDYIALTNEELLNLRRTRKDEAFNSAILDDVSNAVGTHTIIKYVNDLISQFKSTDFSGYLSKEADKVQSGLKEIVETAYSEGALNELVKAGPDGLYKIQSKTTQADTNIEGALNYIIRSLPADYRKVLNAKAVMENFDPAALLLTMIVTNTGRSLGVDYDDSKAKKGAGSGSGSSSSAMIQRTYEEMLATADGLSIARPMVISPENSKTALVVNAQNAGAPRTSNGQPMKISSIAQLLEDAQGIRGIAQSGTVTFGDQVIRGDDLGGLVYNGSNMYRVELPATMTERGEIVPDFKLQETLNNIVQEGKNKGWSAEVIQRYIQEECPGAQYDESTKSFKLPRNRRGVFLVVDAVAASNYIDFDKNSKYLSEDEGGFNPDVYKEAALYGYANHAKNAEPRISGSAERHGWFRNSPRSKHLYRGNVFIAVTSELAGQTFNPGYSYKEDYINPTGKAIQHEAELDAREQLSQEGATTW